jgi:hypothetical protein
MHVVVLSPTETLLAQSRFCMCVWIELSHERVKSVYTHSYPFVFTFLADFLVQKSSNLIQIASNATRI